MQSIEITGKSLDDAKKLAAEQLGVSPGELTVTVLEESKGLFGKSSIKIQASVAEAKPAKAAKAVKAEKAEKPAAAEKPAPKSRGRAKKTEEAPVEASAVAVVEDSATSDAAPEEPAEDVVATEEDEQKIVAILDDLLDAADLEVEIHNTSRNGKYVNIELDGKDVGHLVGKHGEVLNALQYLLNVTVTQQMHSGVRTTIDGGHYRQKREVALTKLATDIATEVRKRQEEAVLDALPAFERRVIHKVLAEMEGIVTYSEGEEPNRRVVIAPAE